MKLKNKTLKSILLLSVLMIAGYAAVPIPGETPPPNYDLFFKEENEQEDYLVGDDARPPVNLSQETETGIGVATFQNIINEDGTTSYKNLNSDEIKQKFEETNTTKTYKDKLNAMRATTDEKEKARLVEEATLEAQKENEHRNISVSQMENLFFQNFDVGGTGSSLANKYFLSDNPKLAEADQNASKFYRDTYGTSQTNARKIKTLESPVNKLLEGYRLVDEFEAQMHSKYGGKNIQCYISRQLIPSFYCTFPDMTNTLFPVLQANVNQLKVASQEAKEKCEVSCSKQRECVEFNVLDSLIIDPKLPALDLFPSYQITSSSLKMPASNKGMVKDVTFRLEITPSTLFEGTEEEFEEFLKLKQIKVRVTISNNEGNTSRTYIPFVDKDIVVLDSTIKDKTYHINSALTNLDFKFFKPYVYESTTDKIKEADIFKMINSIKITNLKGNYASKETYFCPFRQMVDKATECPNGRILVIKNGSQIYNVCTNAAHRAGPDPYYGGFYTRESCQDNCSEKKKCAPTYSQYQDPFSATMFKSEIGCVDDPANTQCTNQKCQEFFADETTRPLNEIVVYNDTTRVNTIQNKVLTGVTRPRIELAKELATTSNMQEYKDMFQTEMKDAAYRYMVDNETFNRIEFPIGIASPIKQAYKKELVMGQTEMYAYLKPNSFDVDSGETQYVYAVLEDEQTYSPAFGLFMIDGQMVDLTSTRVIFKDRTYMIKKPDGTWLVFKKREFDQIKKTSFTYECLNADGKTWHDIPKGEFDPLNPDCRENKIVEWPHTPGLLLDRDVFYNETTDTFSTYDTSMEAPVFVETKFTSDQNYNVYKLSGYLEEDLEKTPGSVIHAQKEKDNGLSFTKVYNGLFNNYARGFHTNYLLHNFYSKTKLSYAEIMAKIDSKEGAIFDQVNSNKYAKYVEHDGELKNQIKPFIFGKPNNTTISAEMWPTYSEENQRTFKFLFLTDDK